MKTIDKVIEVNIKCIHINKREILKKEGKTNEKEKRENEKSKGNYKDIPYICRGEHCSSDTSEALPNTKIKKVSL